MSCFGPKIHFTGKFAPKNQNFLIKMKLGPCSNSNMLNSIVMFKSSLLEHKYPFWASLVQKIKVIYLSLSLVPGVIWICWIQWWCLLFYFIPEIPFWARFGQKTQNCSFKVKFGTYTTSNLWNLLMMFIWTGNILYGKIGSKLSKLL